MVGLCKADYWQMEMHADDEFTVAFDYASGGTAERIQNPLWYITEIFSGVKLRKSIAIVKAYGQQIVSNAVKDRQQGKSRSLTASENKLDEISGSLIQSLLDSIGDESMVADSALNYLSAGKLDDVMSRLQIDRIQDEILSPKP